jgi:2,5-diketo-D-gluconate reductase A
VSRGARGKMVLANATSRRKEDLVMTIPALPLPKAADGTPVDMPLLGFGTWQIRGDAAYQAVRDALEAGYRHLDTATMYGNEAEVGRALKDSGVPRDEVFLTT